MSIISEEDKSREGFKPHTRSRSDMSGLPDTTKRASAPSTKESDSGSVHFGRTRGKLSRIQRQQASTSSTGTSRSITIHSEDIPPMGEEEVGDMRWVEFLTLVDQNGGQYRPRSSTPAAYGGFSDIWQCDAVFSDDEDGVVAVKKLRAVKLPPGLDDSQTTKKLLGVRCASETRYQIHANRNYWFSASQKSSGLYCLREIAIISPWFSRGNVSNYLEAHPEADRMKLAQGVATGLEYLHSSSPVVVHGDMKPSTSLREAGNARWIAPELLLEEGVSRSSWNARATSQLSLTPSPSQILTDDIPFKGIPDGQLVIARHKGASPIPDGAVYPSFNPGSELMEILHSCWNTNHQARPEVGEVVKLLNSTHAGSEPSATQNSQEPRATTGPQMFTSEDVQPPTIHGLSQLLNTAISHMNLPGTDSQAGDVSVPLSVLQEILGLGRTHPQLLRTSSNHAATRKNTAIPTLEATTPSTPKTSKISPYVLTPPVTPAKAKIEAKSLESTFAQKSPINDAIETFGEESLAKYWITDYDPITKTNTGRLIWYTARKDHSNTHFGSSNSLIVENLKNLILCPYTPNHHGQSENRSQITRKHVSSEEPQQTSPKGQGTRPTVAAINDAIETSGEESFAKYWSTDYDPIIKTNYKTNTSKLI
ncbi:hypothetical protein FRC04_001693 [Tulasnella sp. 424]|nr:hypothetical protein FRC04_001693 [Tulasnella sp. 424]